MKKLLLKSMLIAIGIVMGSGSAWADDVASNNFNDQTTPFIIADASRLSVSYALYVEEGTDYYAKYSCGNMNGVAFAYYDFSSSVSDAETVTIDFDFYVAKVAGHALISIADASSHTSSGAGFTAKSNTGYGSTGAIFNLGCYRANNANKFAINSTQNDLEALDAWCHASITVDNANKIVNYTITKEGSELASATGVAFLNSSANRCSQIDLYIGTNASGNAVQFDNIVITKTVSTTTHNYTINAVADGVTLQELASGIALENASYSVSVPKAILKDNVYYILDSEQAGMNAFLAGFTMGTEDEIKEINYTADPSVIYFKEAETIQQSTASETASSGYYCAYYANPQTISISTPGVYQLETNITGRDSNSSLDLYTADGTEAVASFAKNCGTGVKTLTFLADANMRVGGPYYNNKFNNSKSIDYILVRKIADVIDVSHEFIGAVDYSTGENGMSSDDIVLTDGQSYKYVFQNHGLGATIPENKNNFIINISNGGSKVASVYADWWDYTLAGNSNFIYPYSDNGGVSGYTETVWSTFGTDMKDIEVTATISYANGTVTVAATAPIANDSRVYYWGYSYGAGELTGDVTINLSVFYSWLEILSEGYIVSKTFPNYSDGTGIGYATFSHTSAVAVPDGVAVYTGVATNGNIVLTEVEGATVIPANTGVMISGTAGQTYQFVPTATTAEWTSNTNEFIATSLNPTPADLSSTTYYGLSASELKFIKIGSSFTGFSANKAYIKGSTSTTSTAKSLSVTFGDDATAIENIEVSAPANVAVYNLSGQKVDNNYKGIIIKNGKKYLNK